jgi:hypothetical protein
VLLARNENLVIAQGDALQANSWDDHTIHLREHNNYRKTSEFAKADGEVKQKFEFHCQQHEKLEGQQLEREAQRAQKLQASLGPPPSGPQPSSPPPPTPDAGPPQG